MKSKLKEFRRPRDNGSALLIVLGFLSFMMISAVAFAVYMRIERQASSNYRHAANARRMLTSALARAMAEVDAELCARPDGDSCKFPFFDNNSRVMASLGDDSGIDSKRASVLSLEGLGFVPGILANHVRLNAADAEWNIISMPYRDMSGSELAYNEAIVGRYAYACVNVSDMFNVNLCNTAARGAGSNQVSIAYIFKEKESDKVVKDEWIDAFEAARKKYIYYPTLYDFYACMFEETESGNNTGYDSPLHDLLANPTTKAQQLKINKEEMRRHLLVTDSIIKAEPVEADKSFNITSPDLIKGMGGNNPQLDTTFYDAVIAACTGPNNGYKPAFAKMLVDYLDEDHVPVSFDYPSPEIRPMMCQISVTSASGFDIFFEKTVPAAQPGDPDIKQILLNLTKLPPILGEVKTVYPFLRTSYQDNLPANYEVYLETYLRIRSANAPNNTLLTGDPEAAGQGYYAMYRGAYKNLKPKTDIRNGDVDPNEPYEISSIPLEQPTIIGGSSEIVVWTSENGGQGQNGFVHGQPIVITLVVCYAGIKDSAGEFVDVLPNLQKGLLNQAVPARVRFSQSNYKVYFETEQTAALNDSFNVLAPGPKFKWSCLETPDPRFNWKASNWIKSPDCINAEKRPNTSTRNILSDGTGRDADIFMSASNTGKLQSPGELGFLIRPYSYNALDASAKDMNSQTSFNNCEDHAAMFRTFRLYDQGPQEYDKIYDHLYAADEDGFVAGTRVNPLTDISYVLRAAIENVPFDYFLSFENAESLQKDPDSDPPNKDENFTVDSEFSGSWNSIVTAWQAKMEGAMVNPVAAGVPDFKYAYDKNLRDVYPQSYFGWHMPCDPASPDERDVIFGKTINDLQLYEVDRKMLYAFSLDSFSDRQQLFLYFLNAEATAAAFGSRSRSTAGGKAVALVWRDPYPAGYERGESAVHPGRFHEQKVLFFKYLDN